MSRIVRLNGEQETSPSGLGTGRLIKGEDGSNKRSATMRGWSRLPSETRRNEMWNQVEPTHSSKACNYCGLLREIGFRARMPITSEASRCWSNRSIISFMGWSMCLKKALYPAQR